MQQNHMLRGRVQNLVAEKLAQQDKTMELQAHEAVRVEQLSKVNSKLEN